MDYQVIWAPSALQDLEVVAAYVAQDDPQQASSVGEEIIQHVDNRPRVKWRWALPIR